MPLVFAVLTFAALAAAPQPAPRAPSKLFPGLAHLELKQEGVHVWYPKAQAVPVKLPAAYLKAYEEAGVYASQPLTLELGHGVPKATLTCDSGPSADPSCRLLADADNPDSTLFESSGIDFVFLANADIYVYGQSDTLYDHRRLFRFDGKRYVEATQAFRYVGIEGVTKSALVLTAAPGESQHVLITLPPRITTGRLNTFTVKASTTKQRAIRLVPASTAIKRISLQRKLTSIPVSNGLIMISPDGLVGGSSLFKNAPSMRRPIDSRLNRVCVLPCLKSPLCSQSFCTRGRKLRWPRMAMTPTDLRKPPRSTKGSIIRSRRVALQDPHGRSELRQFYCWSCWGGYFFDPANR